MLSNIQKGLKKGFTMIELIFVIVIIGLGIATAVNVGNSGISAQEVSNSVTSPVRDLMIGMKKYKYDNNMYSGLWYKTLYPYASSNLTKTGLSESSNALASKSDNDVMYTMNKSTDFSTAALCIHLTNITDVEKRKSLFAAFALAAKSINKDVLIRSGAFDSADSATDVYANGSLPTGVDDGTTHTINCAINIK